MPNCPNCHAPALPDARFCASCGTRLDAAEGHGDTTPVLSAGNSSALDGDEPTDPNLRVGERPTPASTTDLVTCTRCGAPNVPQRKRCGRCGADISSGEMPRPKPPVQAPPQSAAGVHALPTERFPKPEPIAGPDPTPPRPQPVARAGKPSAVNPPVRTSPRYEDIISEDSMELEEEAAEQRRRRGWIAVAVGGITFGALLGVLLVAATGPFGSGDPDFFFDPGRYDGPAEILEPARLGTSSVRPGDALVSYGPALLMDGDRSTAWQSLPADDGDVFIDLLYDVPVWVTELEFSAGDQSGADAYAATRRPVRVKLTFDGGRAVDVELRDVPAVQRVALDEPRLTGELRITILETVGEDGTGSAMSELSAKGYRADQTDTRTWRAEYD